jgi:capsid protein
MSRALQAAELQRALWGAKLDAAVFKAKYDAISQTTDARRARRQVQVEFVGEDDQVPGYLRGNAIARGRDLQRNYAGAAGILEQMALNVIGWGQKIQLHTDSEGFNTRAGNWFNRIWARTGCDARGDLMLSELCRLELQAVLREGDILMWFDRAGIVKAGALLYWEADQLCEVSDFTLKAPEIAARLGVEAKGLQQAQGVICDAMGRVLAYSVSPLYSAMQQPLDKLAIIPKADAKLLFSPWRVSQKRGAARLLTIANDMQDLREFRAAVLDRAKTQAGLALAFKMEDSATVALGRREETDQTGAALASDPASRELRNHTNLEKWARGAVAYMNPGESVDALNLSGDAPELQAMTEHIQTSSAFGLGLTRLHSLGKADASYSASRAEGNLDEATFEFWQVFMERHSLDWKASKALGWAIDTGQLPAVEGWTKYSWTGWPTQRSLNPAQEATAKKTLLANGLANYSELLGANWRETFEALSEQLAFAREKGIPLEMLAQLVAQAAPQPEAQDGRV